MWTSLIISKYGLQLHKKLIQVYFNYNTSVNVQNWRKYVKGGSDFVRSFLGNRTWLQYFLNNITTVLYFRLKF